MQPELDLRTLFSSTESKDFVKTFESVFHGLDKIRNDDDAELSMMASFCYYDLQDFDRSAKYAEMLMKHLKKENLLIEANELYAALGERVIGSYYHRERKFKAYIIARRLHAGVLANDQVISQTYQNLKREISNTLMALLDYALPTLAFLLVISNLISKIYSPLYSIALLTLLVLLVLKNYRPSVFRRMIDFVL